MSREKIKILFYKYFNDLTTPEENQELARLLQDKDKAEEIKSLMYEAWETFHPENALFTLDESERILKQVLDSDSLLDEDPRPLKTTSFNWRTLAASVALLVTMGGLWYTFNDQSQSSNSTESFAVTLEQDIYPGSNKAFLTLSDGRDIILDHANPGLLTTDGNTKIIKEEGDRLSYEATPGGHTKQSGFNTLRTPRGGQYHVILPDGTKVWLNAASSITYPVHFTGDLRAVKIEGEVFFEVARKTEGTTKIPFIVKAGNISVEVLGTQFNINAYQDENQVKTTLFEGSVKVSTPGSSSLLKPGHEARVKATSTDIQVSKANVDQAIAWKNGYFQFQEASLEEIMRQLSKWYDVDVNFEGKPLEKRFSGEIPRNATLLQVLEILEISQVKMKVDGKEITIKT